MGQLFAYALPIVPGQTERVKRFMEELKEQGHLEQYEELNRQATMEQHVSLLQRTPMGDFLITAFEADDASKLDRPFTDSAYDQWWLDYLRDVHGADFRTGPPPDVPEVVFAWQRPEA